MVNQNYTKRKPTYFIQHFIFSFFFLLQMFLYHYIQYDILHITQMLIRDLSQFVTLKMFGKNVPFEKWVWHLFQRQRGKRLWFFPLEYDTKWHRGIFPLWAISGISYILIFNIYNYFVWLCLLVSWFSFLPVLFCRVLLLLSYSALLCFPCWFVGHSVHYSLVPSDLSLWVFFFYSCLGRAFSLVFNKAFVLFSSPVLASFISSPAFGSSSTSSSKMNHGREYTVHIIAVCWVLFF